MLQCPGSLLVGECELCSFASGKIFITNLKAVKPLLMENVKKKSINIIESFCCTPETHTGLEINHTSIKRETKNLLLTKGTNFCSFLECLRILIFCLTEVLPQNAVYLNTKLKF